MRSCKQLRLFIVSALIGVLQMSLSTDASNTANPFGWKWTYDSQGRLSSLIDPSGQESKYEYVTGPNAGIQQLTQINQNGSKISWKFNDSGILISMSDNSGIVSYDYDDLGRINRIQRNNTPAIAYSYNTLDQIKSLKIGDFYSIEYKYEFLGRIESVKTPVGEIKYEYLTGQGLLIRTLPNGIKTIWTYEPDGQLRQITHTNAQNIILAEYTYQYRPDGLIDAIRERSDRGEHVQSYEYDTVSRLIRMTDSSGQTYEYGYDQLGNRLKVTENNILTQSCSYDWFGRLTSLDGNACEYDAAGNLTSITVNEIALKYSYNQDNQLAEVFGGKAIYQYDGNGQLITRKTGGSESEFIPNPLSDYWQPMVIKEKNKIKTLIVWEGTTPLIMIRDGKPEYLLQDHLGSIRLLADAQGRVLERINYDPFGNNSAQGQKGDFSPGFAGLFWDPQAKAYLTMARVYNPCFAHWQQIEPLKFIPAGSQEKLSLYAYCGNDPVNCFDKNGYDPQRADQSFLDYINGRIIGSYDYALKLGLGSGVETMDDILANAEGRFPAIIIWGSKKGSSWDLFRATFLDTAGLARTDIRTVPIKVVTSVEHSAGNFVKTHNQQIIRLDPAGYLLSQSDIQRPGIVSDLTSGDLKTPFNNKLFGIAFTGASDNLFQAGSEAFGDLLRFSRGVLKLGGGILASPLTKEGPFASHSLKPMLDNLESKGKIPQINTYDKIDVYCIDDSGNINKQTYNYPISNNISEDGLNKVTTSPVGVYYYKRPNLQSEWELWRIHENTSKLDAKNIANYAMKQIEISQNIIRQHDISGGNGRVAGPGGFASPGAISAMEEYRKDSKMSSTTVGGVYLGGASNSLAGLSLLDGISFDSNNNLVLIGQDKEGIKLPPLRLDDVVTVFRSVYLYGEGPTVTIDPSPEKPEESAMIIRHSKATEDTYVGWVLYQADRLMKGYNLGCDNITKEDVSSAVVDYQKILNTIYFGGDDPEKMWSDGHWERFWIVPAESRRYEGMRCELTLFDVPLKVKTQSMIWDHGKLVDDPKGKSSPGANAFTKWFTYQYDNIAQERILTPPKESGIETPVPVFTELRRIALITAIAEKLRDQGIPMPFWMREYPVRSVPFEQFTPSLKVTRTNQQIIAKLFGGVELSASDKDIKNITKATDLEKMETSEKEQIQERLDQVNPLEKYVHDKMPMSEPLKACNFTCEGKKYTAVSLPGSQTQALIPCRMEEADITIQVDRKNSIQLVRCYNSFFNPSGSLGKGWTMDLPRLEKIQIPLKRDNNGVQYQTGYELLTPLNTTYAKFTKVEIVPALGNQCTLQVPDKNGAFWGLADGQPEFLSEPTHKLLLKDGSIWHFSKAGGLVATEQNGFRTVYERDEKGRITRIAGLLGRQAIAFITFKYDSSDRLILTEGKSANNSKIVHYEYDDSGRLVGIQREDGRLGYHYKDSLITAVTYLPKNNTDKSTEVTLQQFAYNAFGQLISQTNQDGLKTSFSIDSSDADNTVTMSYTIKGDEKLSSIRYDKAYRPIEAKYENGTKLSWNYRENGDSILKITDTQGRNSIITESSQDRYKILETDKGYKVTEKYDEQGRLISITENGRNLLSQRWHPTGQLDMVNNEICTAHYEYTKDGLLSRIQLTPPDNQGKFQSWQDIKINEKGLPLEISDCRGMQISMEYDETSELISVINKRDSKNYGFRIQKNKSEQPEEIQSSWGSHRIGYDDKGLMSKWEMEIDGLTSSVEWKAGLIQKVKQFDGGEYSFSYDDKNILKEVLTPNRLNIGYCYNESNQLSKINVGKNYNLALNYDNKKRLTEWKYIPFNE